MYEECDPCPKHYRLYEGVAKVLAKYLIELEGASGLGLVEFGRVLVCDIVSVFYADNPRFNEVHFRRVLLDEVKRIQDTKEYKARKYAERKAKVECSNALNVTPENAAHTQSNQSQSNSE